MTAAAKYAQDDAAESDRPLKVCAEAGRKCVRSIHQYPVLSMEWIGLVDSFKQLRRLVQLEGRMPANTKVGEALGRNPDSDGTLWDQEAHENAIRILVEEAKVNLCLRIMNDYKVWECSPDKAVRMTQAQEQVGLNQDQLKQKCKDFEESLGVLLWKAFRHVETLQLMDIPLLLDHCAVILDLCEKGVNERMSPDSVYLQDTLVLYYVAEVFIHIEDLKNNDSLLRIAEKDLVRMTANHTIRLIHELSHEGKLSVAKGFAKLNSFEDFETNWKQLLRIEDKPLYQALEPQLVAPLIAENPELRPELRPALDWFNRMRNW